VLQELVDSTPHKSPHRIGNLGDGEDIIVALLWEDCRGTKGQRKSTSQFRKYADTLVPRRIQIRARLSGYFYMSLCSKVCGNTHFCLLQTFRSGTEIKKTRTTVTTGGMAKLDGRRTGITGNS